MRPRLVATLDALAALSILGFIVIELTGGFFMRLGPLRLSMRSVDRAVVFAVVLIALRAMIDRRTPAFPRARRFLARGRALVLKRGESVAPAPVPGRVGRAVIASAGIGGIAALLLGPQLLHLGSVPDLGDPLFSIWRMAWVPHQLARDPGHLFDANIFYPDRLTLTYSDSMILPALTAAPLMAAGVHPVVAYNLVFLSGFLLSALATYVLAERLTGSGRAAFIAAVVYGFYPYRFEHYSHFELQMTEWMPLGLLALHLFIDKGRWRYAAALAVMTIAQLYSSMYYAVFFALYATVVAIVLAWGARARVRTLWAPAAIAVLLCSVAAIPLAAAYAKSREEKGERAIPVVQWYSAEPADYLRPHVRSRLWAGHLLPATHEERALFPGVMPLVLGAAALVPPVGTIEVAYAAGLLVAFDGSLGFNGVLYPYLYRWVPPVRSMRVPARFSIIGALSLAILAAFGVRRLLQRVGGRPISPVIYATLVAAVAIDVWPVLRLQPVWRDPPPVYAALEHERRVVLAEFPIHDEPLEFVENTPAMYFSLWHWRPMVNGYSGFAPPSYYDFVYGVIGFPSASAVATLRRRGVTHVTINCAFNPGDCSALLRQVDASGAFRLVSDARWEGNTVRLYELLR